MTLFLEQGTKPVIGIKTYGRSIGDLWKTVFLGDYEISIEDFVCMVKYFMTNTDIYSGDPRLELLEWMKSLTEVDGFNPKGKRLEVKGE
jgi:hypothetical protein